MRAFFAVATILSLTAHAAYAGKVEMCVDASCERKVKRGTLDCKIHKNKAKSLTIGLKIGTPFAKAGPEIGFGRSSSINWNGMSQELIRRYEELCDMHNKGHLSVAEFNDRYAKLEGLYERAKDLKVEIEDTVYRRAEKAFDSLDRESRKYDGEGKLKDRVGELSEKIDLLKDDVSEKTETAKAQD